MRGNDRVINFPWADMEGTVVSTRLDQSQRETGNLSRFITFPCLTYLMSVFRVCSATRWSTIV
jgi:hypothetical protein